MNGLFDTHCHLLPGIDDGCDSVRQSIDCGRRLVEAGYTRAFCTPHIWPNLPHFNDPSEIARRVALLQRLFDEAELPLKLHPGGELNMRADWLDMTRDQIVTYNLAGRVCLFDLWVDRIPDFFQPCVRFLQSHGLTVILAHPERMRVLQMEPDLIDSFAELGLLFQGNLQCFGDPETSRTRPLAERYLREGRYFMLGSDTHSPDTLPVRLAGLQRVRELVDEPALRRLMIENPQSLLE